MKLILKQIVLAITVFGHFASFTSVDATKKNNTCLTVETVQNLDLSAYIAKPWYVQQQAENAYTSREFDQCVTAQYVQKDYKTFWGYDIGVYNVAASQDGETMVGELCAFAQNQERGKLAVAPCFLPKFAAGPYWIVDYDETLGYALISGGQPKFTVTDVPDDLNNCGVNGTDPCCKTGNGINNSGLWIFTRETNPSTDLVNTVRSIAKQKGFATSVLFDVSHPETCNIPDIIGTGDAAAADTTVEVARGDTGDRALRGAPI